ncbi:LacI family DNA-binding transcriptional regulator [Bilophila wadsworthia]|uniref:LacI family DNA-binding transcriptional regulator n=1 Tax=Bilophila wadsworthia TaxID=35833 RepID=UPI0024325B23|nr:LacI family DNA-binding transcriptional regulator [Bilophila wadsworthia]MDR4026480.1 LacI family DNA-binding transcriptional regulator [Bilophila sp.]
MTDISRQSGYSPATVSMILSGRTDVSFSADTVRKVRETAEALGYAPTAKKRPSLFDRKTVLIVCPNVLNPYYSTIVQAIQQAAADKDCDTLAYTTYRDAENEIRILNAVAGSDLAGVVFTMMPQSTELVERVNRLVPVVVIGDRNTSLNVDTVEMNNYSAGAIIAHYMIGLGHKHIAYISTTLNEANSARVRRLEGVRDTYRDECPEGSVIVRSREVTPKEERDNISIEHAVGFELTRKCLGERRITAFVAVNDMVAYGVLDAIRAEGRRVPEDYSVCGFDNIFPSQFLPVGLTTVEHYIADKGRNAFEILHSKMSGESSDRNITRVEFKHHLIVRDSTAAPRGEEKTG